MWVLYYKFDVSDPEYKGTFETLRGCQLHIIKWFRYAQKNFNTGDVIITPFSEFDINHAQSWVTPGKNTLYDLTECENHQHVILYANNIEERIYAIKVAE